MVLDLIDKLNKGITLENCNEIIPWWTPFEELNNFGTPEKKVQSEQRTDLIWKNEKILNGLSVDLTVTRLFGIGGSNKNLKCVFAFISEDELKRTQLRLSTELGQKPRFRKISELEFKYTWDLSGFKVELNQEDRFGLYWLIEIKAKRNLMEILKKKTHTNN
jgi:hypothetical protein